MRCVNALSGFFLILLIAQIVFLNMRASISLKYSRNAGDDVFILSVSAIGGLLKYKYDAPIVDLNLKGIKSRLLRKRGRKEKGIFEYFKRKALLGNFKLDILYGTGDAFSTGIYGGVLWTAAGLLTAFFENNFRTGKKRLKICPDFHRRVFQVELYCIFHLKMVHIIVISYKYLWDYLLGKIKRKLAKGGGKQSGTSD